MLSNNYKISVVVPAYNIKDYLPRCLDSILNQSYSNLEVIVISDGSTDGTNEVIKEYTKKDNRIIGIFKENSGVSDTRNKGLEIATGDYIGFVDGDDYIEPEMYETLLKNALENNADISHCGYQMVFPSRIDYYYNTGKKVLQDNEKGVLDIIKGDYVEPGIWNKLYRKSLIHGIYMDKNIRINEDVLFNVKAFIKAKKSIYEDKAFYHYILRKGSAATSKINKNKIFDPINVCKSVVDLCEKSNDEIKITALNRYVATVIANYRTVKINKLKEFYSEIEQLKSDLKNINKKLLSKRLKVELFLAMNVSSLYVNFYKFYSRYISKNADKYEVR